MKNIFTSALLVMMTLASVAQQKVNVKVPNQKGVYQTSPDTSHYKQDVTLLASPTVTPLHDTSKAVHLKPEQLVWKDVLPPLPAGAKIAVLEGSPKEAGMFTIRFKLPPHWQLPAHWHPGDERVTVLSGSVYVGFGEKIDTTKGTKYSAGSFYINPVKSYHYLYTGSEGSVIQITGMGPWGVTYIEEKK